MVTNIRRLLLVSSVCFGFLAAGDAQQPSSLKVPMFQVDAAWPSIPNNWVLGEVTSISVDRRDHIWVLHVPQSIPEAQRANAAPPGLALDAPGKAPARRGGPGRAD